MAKDFKNLGYISVTGNHKYFLVYPGHPVVKVKMLLLCCPGYIGAGSVWLFYLLACGSVKKSVLQSRGYVGTMQT